MQILLHPPVEGTYEEIGVVKSKGDGWASDDSVYRKLRKAAADLGADAVIVGHAGETYRGNSTGFSYTTGSGAIAPSGAYNYSGVTTSIPSQAVYGLDVSGIAIKFYDRYTADELDAFAKDFDASGKHSLASLARDAARELRTTGRKYYYFPRTVNPKSP